MHQRGDGGFRALTRAAWREFKIAADYSTGMGEVMRATVRPPRVFLEEELGFGVGAGTTLLRSLVDVAPGNAERLADEQTRRTRRERLQSQERAKASATLAARHRTNRLTVADRKRLMRARVRSAQQAMQDAAA